MLGRSLAQARRARGLTQRQLADRAGVPQSTVARIETGVLDPRMGTVERLLRACEMQVDLVPRLGTGVDRTQLRERLRLAPVERLAQTVAAAHAMTRIRGRARTAR